MESVVERCAWVDETSTAVVHSSDGSFDWWTFAGLAANSALAELLGPLRREDARAQNLAIPLASQATLSEIRQRLQSVDPEQPEVRIPVTDEALEGLKFHACLPRDLAHRVIEARLADPEGVRACLEEPIRFVMAEA